MSKRFTVYSDVTGTGTGDFMAEFDTLEEATTFAEAEWTPEVGYAIHEEDKYPCVATRPPTEPDPDPGEHVGWIDLFEMGYF